MVVSLPFLASWFGMMGTASSVCPLSPDPRCYILPFSLKPFEMVSQSKYFLPLVVPVRNSSNSDIVVTNRVGKGMWCDMLLNLLASIQSSFFDDFFFKF